MQTLQTNFDEFNLKYWDGKLPQYSVLRRNLDGDLLGYTCIGEKKIFIAPRARRTELRTLLHEMAHVAVPDSGHSEAWLIEMKRLQSMGALRIQSTEQDSVLRERAETPFPPECCLPCLKEYRAQYDLEWERKALADWVDIAGPDDEENVRRQHEIDRLDAITDYDQRLTEICKSAQLRE